MRFVGRSLAMLALAACSGSGQSNGGGSSDMASPTMAPPTAATVRMGGNPGMPGPASFGVTLSTAEQGDVADSMPKVFHLGSVIDLWVRVTVPVMNGQVTKLSITFINPLGEIFYEDSALYTPDPSMKTVPAPAMGHPVNVYQAKPVSGGFALDRPIPIAGGVFHRVPLLGKWIVQAQIDGNPMIYSTNMDVVW